MFGKLGDMMGKLQDMKQKAEEVKANLEKQVITNGLPDKGIVIQISGNRKIKSVQITEEALRADRKTLESDLLTAMNNAIEAADRLSETELKKVAGDLMPKGLF